MTFELGMTTYKQRQIAEALEREDMERRRKAKEREQLREAAEQKTMEEEENYQREINAYWAAVWAEEERNRVQEQRRLDLELQLEHAVEWAIGE